MFCVLKNFETWTLKAQSLQEYSRSQRTKCFWFVNDADLKKELQTCRKYLQLHIQQRASKLKFIKNFQQGEGIKRDNLWSTLEPM